MSSLHVVLMGVSGSGKTTLARKMAERTGWELLEADDLHPEADMEILQGGKLPSEEKRIDWLGSVRDWMTERAAESKNTIVACTALRKEHREVLNQAEGVVFYVHPYGTEDVLADRMRRRVGKTCHESSWMSSWLFYDASRQTNEGSNWILIVRWTSCWRMPSPQRSSHIERIPSWQRQRENPRTSECGIVAAGDFLELCTDFVLGLLL